LWAIGGILPGMLRVARIAQPVGRIRVQAVFRLCGIHIHTRHPEH
jgi:hypothetical protein